jgi:hypothetical protein
MMCVCERDHHVQCQLEWIQRTDKKKKDKQEEEEEAQTNNNDNNTKFTEKFELKKG